MSQKFVFRKVMFFILIAGAAIIVFGGAVMLLWNNVLATVLNISPITFGQALGILLLAKILFGGWRGGGWGGGRHHWKNKMREKWSAMTPEEREKFKQQWQKRCGPWGATFSKPDTSVSDTNSRNPIDHS
jgi:Ca2+/H+ antiporter, TMEM165/GDT1 family